jgi:NADPH:quinone reductase
MVEVRRSTVLEAPIEEVWAILRDFNGHETWHPSVGASQLEDGASGDMIGAVRDFCLHDGSRIREQLLALSDVETSFTYCIIEAPVMLRNYHATIRLRPVTSDGQCFWEWWARFDPSAADRERLLRFVAHDIFEAGFQSVRALLCGESRPTAPRPRSAIPVASSVGAMEAAAIVVTRYGGPNVMEMRTVRVEAPGPGEVRIRQSAIGVNFIDIYMRNGSLDLIRPPAVPGMEAVGTVESIGPDVASLSPGDRVGYACAPPGAYTAMRTMNAELVFPLPDFLGDEAAAAMLLKGISASFLLHDVYAVKRGDVVLVHAAAGGVGSILCRWAGALGATVIGTTSNAVKAEQARQGGCAHVILYTQEDFAEAVMRLTAGRGADVVYDGVGNDTFEISVRALALRGHLVSFGQASGDVGVHSIDKLASRSVTLSRPNYGHYSDTEPKLMTQTDRLFAALRAGAIVAKRPTSYRLAEASVAHTDLETRKTMGSLVLIP